MELYGLDISLLVFFKVNHTHRHLEFSHTKEQKQIIKTLSTKYVWYHQYFTWIPNCVLQLLWKHQRWNFVCIQVYLMSISVEMNETHKSVINDIYGIEILIECLTELSQKSSN